jgi:hypothetical protein
MEDIIEDNHYSIKWNLCLSNVASFNVLMLIFYVLIPKRNINISFNKNATKIDFWKFISKYQHILALIYVVACGIRSIWPRKDGDRICFNDSWISIHIRNINLGIHTVFVGRTLATCAELAYCAQLCLAIISMTHDTYLANIVFVSNIIAQSCCWYSVITRDQRGHTIEETIWMLTGLSLTYTCYNIDKNKLSTNAKKFSKLAVIFGSFYVIFMCTIDIPMYYNRYINDYENNTIYQTFSKGLIDTTKCLVVSQSDSIWVKEMPWMSLYFSFAVWSSIWLASRNLSNNDEKYN